MTFDFSYAIFMVSIKKSGDYEVELLFNLSSLFNYQKGFIA